MQALLLVVEEQKINNIWGSDVFSCDAAVSRRKGSADSIYVRRDCSRMGLTTAVQLTIIHHTSYLSYCVFEVHMGIHIYYI